MIHTIQEVLEADLRIFAGEGGAASGAAAGDGSGDAAGNSGENTTPSAAGKKSGDLRNVVYGKQNQMVTDAVETQDGDAGQSNEGDILVQSDSEVDRRSVYNELINGEYKDLYTQDTQNMINKRFKEMKTLQSQVQSYMPVIDTLMQRYRITDGDIGKLQNAIENDEAYLTEAADEAGMTVDQFKAFQKLERENKALVQAQQQRQMGEQVNAQVQRWVQEAEALKQTFPNFDLNQEVQNQDFVAMLKKGVPVEHAFKVIHFDDIIQEAMRTTAVTQEQRIVDNVRARGMRPSENGVSQRSAFTVKDDVSKLSKKDRAEIARRVARGEVISF